MIHRTPHEYLNRDVMVRWFHWINVLAIIALGCLGTSLLFGKELGLSDPGKILIKTTHVFIGYIFVTNLLIRLVWAFVGSENARWRNILPGGHNFVQSLRFQARNLFSSEGHRYDGHSPLGRVSIALMLLAMMTMAVTGLTLAGTDIFYPPLGSWISEWVAAEGVDPKMLVPYQPELVNEAAWEEMRAFRAPFKDIHELIFFVLLAFVPLHVIGVVLAEVKGNGGIVSAMINGRKNGTKRD